MIKVIKVVFLTLLFIFGITFAMENVQPVVLRYHFGLETTPLPLFLVVLFAALLGVLLAGLGFLLDLRFLKKSLREREREIESLRNKQISFAEAQPTMPQRVTAGN
jgi:uncharacterized integral membrane protein